MDMTNVQPMFEPDPVQMRRHVGHLFEGWLDGCQEGRIELAWTDARDGKLRHAAIFGTDQLDELVERAVAENRRPGQNLYIGQALRQPGIAPFGRCGDDEVFALTAFGRRTGPPGRDIARSRLPVEGQGSRQSRDRGRGGNRGFPGAPPP